METIALITGKLRIVQAIAILILWFIYGLAVQGLVDLFSTPLGLGYDPFVLSLGFSFLGVVLGFVMYGGNLLEQKWKNVVTIITGSIIIGYLIGGYLIYGIPGLGDSLVLLMKLGLGLLLCMIPLIGAYGIIKRQRNVILASGAGVVFFFFFTRLLLRNQVFVEEQLHMLLLFFILTMVYNELGSKTIFYFSALDKMTSTNQPAPMMIQRFNKVLDHYLMTIGAVFSLVYIGSFSLVQFGSDLFGFTGEQLMNINLTTFAGMLLLVGIIVGCAALLWSIHPRERQNLLTPKPTQRKQSYETHSEE